MKGIEDRITFRLGLEMKKLDVTLNYEVGLQACSFPIWVYE